MLGNPRPGSGNAPELGVCGNQEVERLRGNDVEGDGDSSIVRSKRHRPMKHIGGKQQQVTFLWLHDFSYALGVTQTEIGFAELDPAIILGATENNVREGYIVAGADPAVGVNMIRVETLPLEAT